MMSSSLTVAMVAGESSGDLIAASMLAGIQSRQPQLTSFGIGGQRMMAHGFESLYPIDKLSVFGYLDALRHLPELLNIRRQLKQVLTQRRPDVFVGIDAPDFNFNLERYCLNQGIPTVHFVSPSIWAWRKERIKTIKASVAHMLVLFPFETEIYQNEQIPVTFVGHPLASQIPLEPDRASARASLGLSTDIPVLALMPGSRASEIKWMAPRFLAAAALLQKKYPELHCLVPMASEQRVQEFNTYLAGFPELRHVHVLLGGSHTCLAACNAVIVASGTASLEAALFKRPMVISYVVSRMTAWLLKNKSYLPWYGLPNILHNEFVVPELIQDDATPEALAAEAEIALFDQAHTQQLTQLFTQMHHSLKQDTATLSAQVILSMTS